MNSKIKNIIIFSFLAIVLVLLYFFFIKKIPEEKASIVSSGSSFPVTENTLLGEVEPKSEEFVSLLLSVKSIKLDDTIFSDRIFSSLEDSSIVLVQEGNEGRPNPFAPIGQESLPFIAPTEEITPTIGESVPN